MDSKIETIEIVKLNDKIGYVGSKGLLSGSLEQEVYYYVMLKQNDLMKLEKLKANEWFLKEIDDQTTPRLEITKSKVESKGILGLLVDVLSSDGYIVTQKVICVPKGTIVEEYNISLS